jgi:hypothetical protein
MIQVAFDPGWTLLKRGVPGIILTLAYQYQAILHLSRPKMLSPCSGAGTGYAATELVGVYTIVAWGVLSDDQVPVLGALRTQWLHAVNSAQGA